MDNLITSETNIIIASEFIILKNPNWQDMGLQRVHNTSPAIGYSGILKSATTEFYK